MLYLTIVYTVQYDNGEVIPWTQLK